MLRLPATVIIAANAITLPTAIVMAMALSTIVFAGVLEAIVVSGLYFSQISPRHVIQVLSLLQFKFL